MAIRKDLMTASDVCDTQKTSADSDDYYTMNYLSGTKKEIMGFTITVDPVGTERKVINQLLFVEAPVVEELEPFELGEPASRPSTNYNGNVVSVTFTGDIPVGAAVTAQLTLDGSDSRQRFPDENAVGDDGASLTLPKHSERRRLCK